MADHKTIVVLSDGGADVHINKANLGFSPVDTHRNFQISVHGLDGGTYSVSYYPVNCSHVIEYQGGATEAAAVVMSHSIDFLYEGLVISFNGLGAAAAPKVHATFWPRGL